MTGSKSENQESGIGRRIFVTVSLLFLVFGIVSFWPSAPSANLMVSFNHKVNNNARQRAIVFHKSYFFWTYGCFGTWPSVNDKIVELANRNALIYVHRNTE